MKIGRVIYSDNIEFFRINMLHRKTSQHSPVFKDFETLGKQNYHEIVHFCERNRDAMFQLNFDEFFIMELAHCNALFEMKYYKKHIFIANSIIELSILNNVQFYQGEDIYHKTLFQKAQAHKLINDVPQAIHIAKELLKMTPNSKEYHQFLKVCYTKSGTKLLENLKNYGALLCFVSAGLLVLNLLIVEPLFPQLIQPINIIVIIGFIIGGLSLVGGLTIHHWQARRKLQAFIKTIVPK